MAFSRKQKKAFLTAAVTAGVYLSFRYLLPLVFPFLAAYLMALFLRPSAAFLEKRLRISFRGRTIGIPIGVIGGVELILLCILLFVLLAAGGRRFMEELERFLEELPGRMEELSLLGGQFEQSAERFLHLPAGRLGQLFRGTGLQGGGQVKEILLPQLLQKSVPAAARIVRAVVVVVLFFIASILSLQEMDELRRRRFDSMFHREFFLLGRRLAVTGSAWLKTQSVIFLMTSSLSMLGLLLIGNPYYILGGIGIGVLDALPIFGTQLPDGKWLSTWLSTPGRNNPENPLMELHEGNTKRQLHRILGRINIGYDLPWGIKYNANLGYVKVDHYSKDFKHAMYTYNPKTLERKNFSAYVSAKDWDNNAINYTFYNTLSWGKSFGGNHNFNVMVGTEYKRYDGKNFQAKKRDYFNNQLTALSVGSTMEDISGGSSLELLFSYFGRITYDYKEKYLIDVTARYDGSSKFAKGNRWAFFPAVSVGWRIDKENFMQNVRAVDVLKLRGSVGEMGNQAIG